MKKSHTSGTSSVETSRLLASDTTLTNRARGLYMYIWAKDETYQPSVSVLAAELLEGPDALLRALRELESHGWVVRRTFQDDRGRWTTEFTIYDTPVAPDER